VKLPETQFALDPGVAKFHDPAATAILFLSFLACHLLSEREHRRAFL